MLLKRLASVFALLCFYISLCLSQNFKSGLVRLTSASPSLPSNYSINYDHQTNDLIIAICSFAAQPLTSCFISAKTNRQANFTCTSNIQTIAFLFYEKTPMIYANSFSYYFFSGSKEDRQGYAVWKVQKGLTVAVKPQLRAILAGFKARDDLINKIELNELEDGWSINITRTPNIQVVNFSYILIQNYSPYNLTFVDYIVAHSNNLSLIGLRKNYLNFWGVQSFRSTRSSLNIVYGVTVNFDSVLATDSNILSVNSFSMPNNTSIQGLFLLDNTNLNTLNCGTAFYDPSSSKCISQCLGGSLNWNTSIFQYRYCLKNESGGINATMMNETYIDSNLWEMAQYTQIGCAQSALTQDGKIVCRQCSQGYSMYQDQCVCRYGSYLSEGTCHRCTSSDCQLAVTSSIRLANALEPKRILTLTISLPIQHKYNISCQAPFEMNVTINNLIYSSQVQFEGQSRSLNIAVSGVSANNYYEVIAKANGNDPSQLLLIGVEGRSFLWGPSVNMSLTTPVAPQQAVLQSIAPLLADTDKSMPAIMLVIFFLGDKINTLSLFQTVSLLYLINFMPIGEQYNPLLSAISQIFIFQPKPLIVLAGSHQDAWIFIPAVNSTEIPYNKLIHAYTRGEMFLSFALNCLASLLIQLGGIVAVLKLAKKCLKQSNNRVSPYIAGTRSITLDLRRSTVDENGRIKWLRDIEVRESASLRYKCYVYLCKLDDKKWIGISSLWNMHILSLCLLLLHELSIPFSSFYSVLSSLSCYLTLCAILFFPLYLRQYQPLYLLKCLSICYKRKQYQRSQLWLYYYLNSTQSLLYACIIIASQSANAMIGFILVVMAAKVFILRSKVKRIEVLRAISIGVFFVVALVSCNVEAVYSSTMTSIMAYSLTSVVIIQILKLLRSVIILILNCFKTSQSEPKQSQISNPPIEKQTNPVLDYFQNKHIDKKISSEPTTFPTITQKETENGYQYHAEDSSKDITSKVEPQYKSRAFRRRLANHK